MGAALGLVLPLCRASAACSQTLEVQGQLSTWVTLNDQNSTTAVLGLRYLPTLTIDQALPAERRVDAELSLNAYAAAPVGGADDLSATAKVKPYRLWTPFKSARFEAQVGLQKLNFGSPTLLRPRRRSSFAVLRTSNAARRTFIDSGQVR
jgi:hypothetical protein